MHANKEQAVKETAPAVGPVVGWRRCADEMPDSDSTVMIHHAEEGEPVWMGYHDGETWRQVDGARCAVTHWMPLPEPPNASDQRPGQ